MITPDDLLAQPADQYMNDQQLEFFKEKLVSMAQDFHDRLENHRQDVEIDRHPDEADFASDEEERAIAVKMLEHDRSALRRVRHALELIRVGDYGFCKETGEPIGLQRLLLVPDSVYCVEAMRLIEAKSRHLLPMS